MDEEIVFCPECENRTELLILGRRNPKSPVWVACAICGEILEAFLEGDDVRFRRPTRRYIREYRDYWRRMLHISRIIRWTNLGHRGLEKDDDRSTSQEDPGPETPCDLEL